METRWQFEPTTTRSKIRGAMGQLNFAQVVLSSNRVMWILELVAWLGFHQSKTDSNLRTTKGLAKNAPCSGTELDETLF